MEKYIQQTIENCRYFSRTYDTKLAKLTISNGRFIWKRYSGYLSIMEEFAYILCPETGCIHNIFAEDQTQARRAAEHLIVEIFNFKWFKQELYQT